MTTRRRHPRKCLLCNNWSTRHPSRICRDCRPCAGTAVVNFSRNIEKGLSMKMSSRRFGDLG